MQRTIDEYEHTVRQQKDQLAEYEATTQGLRTQLNEPAMSSALSSTPTPAFLQTVDLSAGFHQLSTGKFVIASKVYARIPAGLPNEGLYMEKEGRVRGQHKVSLTFLEDILSSALPREIPRRMYVLLLDVQLERSMLTLSLR